LLLFASGVKHIPLAMLGFLQYIAPTIMLLLGVFHFKETFSFAHFISFGMIWIALLIYMGSAIQRSSFQRRTQPYFYQQLTKFMLTLIILSKFKQVYTFISYHERWRE